MSAEFDLPQSLVDTNMSFGPPRGAEWLAGIPGIVRECSEKWALTVWRPFEKLSYNYAAPAVRADGTPAVLKICYPDRDFRTEEEALRIYAGRGSVLLLEVDVERGAMLLEHVRPGTLLYALGDDARATSIAAGVMRELWQPAPSAHPFPTVEDWARGMSRLREEFAGGTGPFSESLVEEAEGLFRELLPSQGEQVVLHGDLHHYNILAAERAPWLAIDPKGVVGEREYEVGALLRNPLDVTSWPDLKGVLVRRLAQLSEELGFDREKLRAWGLAQAVLSAWWSYEDHGRPGEDALTIAQVLSELA